MLISFLLFTFPGKARRNIWLHFIFQQPSALYATVVTRLFIYRWKLGEIDAFKIHDFLSTYVWGVDIEISIFNGSYSRNL